MNSIIKSLLGPSIHSGEAERISPAGRRVQRLVITLAVLLVVASIFKSLDLYREIFDLQL